MVVTIQNSGDYGCVWISSKHHKFNNKWGGSFKIEKRDLFDYMYKISSWANNELNEEMLFDLE